MTLLAGFGHTDEAGGAVSGVIAAGILPAAIEMMDAVTIEAAEAAVNANYPDGCGAVLIVELDGPAAQVEDDLARVEAICREHDAREIRIASDPADRAAVWRGRKAAFAAMGRISPDYYVQDGVVPRTKLPSVLRAIDELSREHGLRVGNVFHAGDGNLHPLVLYDGRVEGEAARAEELSQQILEICIDAGGSITGEHGVGTDKACAMPLMFSEDDLAAMQRLRRAFDPLGLANPGQALPDAAPVRRGAGAVPRAPAREGRACRPLLSPDPRARARRPDLHRRGRHPALDAPRGARGARAAPLARPARRPDARRVPARRPVRPAQPPLRDDARPRDRRHGRPAGRDCGRARAARS